jgi:hypothetical protein
MPTRLLRVSVAFLAIIAIALAILSGIALAATIFRHQPGILRLLGTCLFYVALAVVLCCIPWKIPIDNDGHCVACKYNLTGNVSGTCPECGTKIE